jgi:hypothetical protein
MFKHYGKKGHQPDTYHEYGYSTETPRQDHAPADDVFGDEEGAQVRQQFPGQPPNTRQTLPLTVPPRSTTGP